MRRSLICLLFTFALGIPAQAGICQWLLQSLGSVEPLQELPEFQTAKDVQNFIEKHPYRYDLFPRVPKGALGPIDFLWNDGGMNVAMYRSELNGKEVVIKSFSLADNSIGEVAWLHFLNQHGIGVRLHGVVKVQARWSMVMDKVPGMNSKLLWLLRRRPNLRVTPVAVQSMRDQLLQLHRLQVEPYDWQFMVHEDQATLIDVGLFSVATKEADTLLQSRLHAIDYDAERWRNLGILVDEPPAEGGDSFQASSGF